MLTKKIVRAPVAGENQSTPPWVNIILFPLNMIILYLMFCMLSKALCGRSRYENIDVSNDRPDV